VIFAFINGFFLSASLIIAIGAQNAFILRQGLLRSNVFVLCLLASFFDAALIFAGVAGFGAIVNANQTLLQLVTAGGAVFLFAYAALAAKRAWRPHGMEAAAQAAPSLRRAIATLLAFTFLNPHVYLDTVVLLGGLSGAYSGNARVVFGIGALLASFVWFFSLGYGARWLTPLFAKPAAWRMLDGLIALVMALLALSLIARLV
jgi:L-lysine exporter family protein LysE/ArgO